MRLLFDRGTIIVRDPPAGFDAAGLPGVLWDPRVGAFRAPARHHPAARVLLAEWIGAIRAGCPHAVGCLGDGRRELAPITVATFEGAFRQMDQLGARFELLVVDEAHHFGAGLRDEALEMSVAPARLGL